MTRPLGRQRGSKGRQKLRVQDYAPSGGPSSAKTPTLIRRRERCYLRPQHPKENKGDPTPREGTKKVMMISQTTTKSQTRTDLGSRGKSQPHLKKSINFPPEPRRKRKYFHENNHHERGLRDSKEASVCWKPGGGNRPHQPLQQKLQRYRAGR